MQKNPLIGVVPLWDETKDSIWMLPGYMDGVQNTGGIPLMLPLTDDEAVIKQLVSTFDGFLFTGGHDVDPKLYGEKAIPQCGEVCAIRDSMENKLFQFAAIERNKPVFGICRGIQLFNALLGGTLYQDLPSQYKSETKHQQTVLYDKPIHRVSILQDTPLYKLFKTDELSVNSYHHQAVKKLSDKLVPMAVSEDGLIEAVCMPDKKFVWAVQWHPEYMLNDNYSQTLFKAFVNNCRESI
jgi:putative glutamine amidotransferase